MMRSGSADLGPEQGAFVDLSSRAKLRLTGTDRLRYLNGQISNDLRKASEAEAIHACVLGAKGKINAEIFVAAEGDAFLLDTDPEMAEQLSARLERYIIADDVQIEDVTEEFALFHVIGVEAPSITTEAARRKAKRFGVVGTDLWLKPADYEKARLDLSQTLAFCDASRAEIFRIEQGIPRWGRELTDAIIPTEANLEASAIDYAKGCYIGQEVISRIKMSGQTNKRLCGFVAETGVPLRAGMRLVTPDEQKEVGTITSVARSDRLGRQIALGFVKRGFQTVGTALLAVPESGVETPSFPVTIVPLPFTARSSAAGEAR